MPLARGGAQLAAGLFGKAPMAMSNATGRPTAISIAIAMLKWLSPEVERQPIGAAHEKPALRAGSVEH